MQITKKYSHLNGEEYLIVHHKDLYEEIKNVISSIDAQEHKTKVSNEKRILGKLLYNPDTLNGAFNDFFRENGWKEERYSYCVTTDYQTMQELVPLSFVDQKTLLKERGIDEPLTSYKQTDFVKKRIAIEVQFGKYAFVAYDLFVKHLLFYSGSKIDLGVEILPTKKMQSEMSSGVAYYEGEVYNVLRHGRSNPPVPLLILGIEP